MAEHADRTVGVTGSKGKSTTSSLISHLLTGVGRPNVFGGNIGVPLLDLPEAECYVLELSSYQCADLTESPRVAVVTSLFPEHLDAHGGEREYYRDKLNLLAYGPETVVPFDAADPSTKTTAMSDVPSSAQPWTIGAGPDEQHLVATDGKDRFRSWLEARYGTIEQLNVAWGSTFGSFATVTPPTTDAVRRRELDIAWPQRLCDWNDHREFMDQVLADTVGWLADRSRALAPGVPVGFEGGQPPAAFGGSDWSRLLERVATEPSFDSYLARERRASRAFDGKTV